MGSSLKRQYGSKNNLNSQNELTPNAGSFKNFQEALKSLESDKNEIEKNIKSRKSSERPKKKKTNFIKLNAKQLSRVKTGVNG